MYSIQFGTVEQLRDAWASPGYEHTTTAKAAFRLVQEKLAEGHAVCLRHDGSFIWASFVPNTPVLTAKFIATNKKQL